jgi:hypothetical protein
MKIKLDIFPFFCPVCVALTDVVVHRVLYNGGVSYAMTRF